jgi:predicted helicase
MTSTFRQALQHIREKSNNTTELGTAFEKMVKVFLENDPTQTQQYEQVWHYTDWVAGREGYSGKDIGIDLVAKIHGQNTFCAIQCKCYSAENQITKQDLDSFVSASANKDFSRLLLIDTSSQGIAPNAQQVLDKLDKEYLRIQSSELENCRIDWLTLVKKDELRFRAKHGPRPHQTEALEKTQEGFAEYDRGKIIMACGTGKTYTSLIISEAVAGAGKTVLYMVPSLSLMSQTIREWKNDATEDFTAFSACSDQTVGSRKKDDEVIISTNDLAFPATTNPKDLADAVAKAPRDRMTVVFSTYHSIDVISEAQKTHGLTAFDLIVCDEAHRTTGATLVGDDESSFVKIHNNDNVNGAKRLYMTATPRIYGEKAKSKADDENVTLASMDDEDTYGPLFFYKGFGWAVENNLLTDYKVVVLAVDEGIVSEKVQNRLAEGAELKLDDATKIIGCFKALAKEGFKEADALDFASLKPMKRALAFCQNIKLSKLLEQEFTQVVNEYRSNESEEEKALNFQVDLRHVDGGFDADLRNERLNWLKDDADENACRVLTNVRCLSEGVDVPALDAVIFMHPRKSQIDVVQSVGRVMRKAEGKDLGYVIIPITVAPGVSPEKALNDNEKYRVVWQILNALRSHDERFDSTINKMGLGEDVSGRIEIVGVGAREELEATTAVVDDIKPKRKDGGDEGLETEGKGEREPTEDPEPTPGEQLAFVLSDLSKAIKAKIVERCGTRDYWENWAKDIAKIAQAHITRIKAIVFNSGTKERKLFEEFVAEIRDDLNPSITEEQAVEMLAQHLVTKPVFETLFKDHKFTEENPVSKSMQSILTALSAHRLEKESDSLQKFYESVKRRAADIETSTGRQTLILELYERFFSYAFKSMTERLGIVYTPVEVVDFIIHSVEDVLREEFGTSIAEKNVHVLDPFVGTGTFISRLLQSGLIDKQSLKRKFESEIHANEIVLLAYYIASINAESVYQDLTEDHQYRPFNGIVLTDTFQLYEEDRDMIANLLPDNSERRKNQRKRKINVIIGNPPYSAGQTSANDNAANVKYSNLDRRIEGTYAASSSATLKNSLYDSYIRAFRMASDRIGDEGVIGFVTGAGWIDGNATDGMRKCLVEEFNKIYVFNLRGNQRTSGELSRREGGKIFGSGSRSPIAITILVRKRGVSPRAGQIFYCDIGDYFDREEKLRIISLYKSISGIKSNAKWLSIQPDEKNDWLNQTSRIFDNFSVLGDKKSKQKVFREYSNGVKTQRDAWCYNASYSVLVRNCELMISTYNEEVSKLAGKSDTEIRSAVTTDKKRISWSDHLFQSISRGRIMPKRDLVVRESIYRPFYVTNLFFERQFNDRQGQIPKIYSDPQKKVLSIMTTGVGAKDFSCLMVNRIPDIQLLFNGQLFPSLIEIDTDNSNDLFQDSQDKTIIVSGILQTFLDEVRKFYRQKELDVDTLFFYIYGVLHSKQYRASFSSDLLKSLPRLPLVPLIEKFFEFSTAGKLLSDLHANFDTQPTFGKVVFEVKNELLKQSDPENFYRVKQMKFAGTRGREDKTTVIYNEHITIKNIPIEAYEYVVNGKPALEWVMERQCVKVDKDSGIVNDANDYAIETMNNPAYPLELFQRVITVSLETMKIVQSLPPLDL